MGGVGPLNSSVEDFMPNISIVELNRLRKIEEQFNSDRMVRNAQEFADHFCKNIGIMLASTPFDKWPEFAQNIYRISYDQMPTSAAIYKDLLPKE